eukprot:TRINITY_DN15068_c0_g1_i2.p1 TRINITY_DN15068_c0_g1~~TRINITY_DN15068_c0_g1_i2.p1  ORF type:complete len:576 (-),score=113.97 TRINITY_DN15068_c0_g1_i2:76-1803(-)
MASDCTSRAQLRSELLRTVNDACIRAQARLREDISRCIEVSLSEEASCELVMNKRAPIALSCLPLPPPVQGFRDDNVHVAFLEDAAKDRSNDVFSAVKHFPNKKSTLQPSFTLCDDECCYSEDDKGTACSDITEVSRCPCHQETDISKERRMLSRIGIEAARRTRQDQNEKHLWHMSARELLDSSKFDNLVGTLILINAIVLGVQSDYAARKLTDEFPPIFSIFERIFCVAFTSELFLRLYVMKLEFFYRTPCSVLAWNYFDLLVVSSQWLQEILELVATSSGGKDMKSFRLLRVLRILRLVRILRVVRVLRLISELRTIVSSILGSFKSLAWTMVLLLLMIYIVGVYFLQSVTDVLVGKETAELKEQELALRYHFGSLGRALLSLWEAISGGEDWNKMIDPLIAVTGVGVGFVYIAYISFALLALMNVVTGFFVHTALLRAKKEEEIFVADQIVSLFNMSEETEITTLSQEEIVAVLHDPECAREWKAIEIMPEEANYIFRLLDIDGTGSVEFQEFLNGCLRISGPAQSMDLLTVMQEARASHRLMKEEFKAISNGIKELSAGLLPQRPPPRVT